MKHFDRIKNKKAFTLVELIIVVAIIGVLSGILIPILVSVVRDANVASANTAANDVRKFVNTWITTVNAGGHTVNSAENTEDEPYIKITAERGEYKPIFSETFWVNNEDEEEMKQSLCDYLMDNLGYRELYAVGYVNKGTVAALCYCVNEDESTIDLPTYADFFRDDYWSGSNGYASDGTLIGTSPQIKNG